MRFMNRKSNRVTRLLVVSHVVHFQHEGCLYAYGAYAREIDIWADIFPQVLIAAPCRNESPPGDAIPFTRTNIGICPQPERGGDTAIAKLKQIASLPLLLWNLGKVMRQVDAIHVRCPGNLGLLGTVMAPFFSRRIVAKYAGQWNGYAGEPIANRLQRFILKTKWWHGPVTVYGEWTGQRDHVIPFFTSMMTGEQVALATRKVENKKIHRPLRILFSGRLVPVKRVSVLIDALYQLILEGTPVVATIVGDGPERPALEAQVHHLEISDHVHFVGAHAFNDSLPWYEWADCLVLPSKHSEGWPKVIAEAMCYGITCIAVDHGQLVRMLTGRGVLLKEGSAVEIAGAIREIIAYPETARELGRVAALWAERYSLDGLRQALRDLLEDQWQVDFSHPESSQPFEEGFI
jgi:glycosyltransferase involved in cell wall biosynthesis